VAASSWADRHGPTDSRTLKPCSENDASVNKDGTINHIVPAAVCMAILEYCAFEARSENNQAAPKMS
jgi:hypothetical protein